MAILDGNYTRTELLVYAFFCCYDNPCANYYYFFSHLESSLVKEYQNVIK